jgi:hypothetical protein
VRTGASIPPVAWRCIANRPPITPDASTSAGFRVVTVVSRYAAVDVTTGRRRPAAAYSAPRKKISSPTALASVVVRTSGDEPWSAYRSTDAIERSRTGIRREATANP